MYVVSVLEEAFIMPEKEKFLTVNDVKDILHYSDSRTVIKLFNHNAMHAFQISNRWYVKDTDFYHFMDLLRKYRNLDSIPGTRYGWAGYWTPDSFDFSGNSFKDECRNMGLSTAEINRILEAFDG